MSNVADFMPALTMIDGAVTTGMPISDRACAYGHGLFETMLLCDSVVPLWMEHCQRMVSDSPVLGIHLEKQVLQSSLDNFNSNLARETQLMQIDEAKEKGAMALFGEKYGDEVRVVAMGRTEGGADYSLELCGGIHVKRTGDIGYFKIVSEGAVSSGVRRLEVLTGKAACTYSTDQENYLFAAATIIKTPVSELSNRLNTLILERKAMEKELSELQKKIALGGNISSDKKVEDLNGIKFVGKVLNGIPAKELRSLADEAKMRIGSGVISFITVNDGKVAILTAVTEDLINSVSALDLARVGSIAVGGKGGGGRADMAQAGGPNGMEADKALKTIKNYLSLLKNL